MIKITHISEDVTGINRDPMAGESVIEVNRNKLINGWHHRFYKVIGGELSALNQAEIDVIKGADTAEADAETARISGIEAAMEGAGLKKVSIAQAENFIDSKLDAATDLATLRESCRDILKKMVPYILE